MEPVPSHVGQGLKPFQQNRRGKVVQAGNIDDDACIWYSDWL